MAEFLPNLDDGELWAPSDVLLNDAAAHRYRMALALAHRRFPPMGQLSRSCSAFTPLPLCPSDPFLSLSQRIGQPAQYIDGAAMTTSGAVHRRAVPFSSVAPKLLCDEYRLLRQAQMPQVEAQPWGLPHRQLPNHVGVSRQGGGGVSRKERGGTGVFLPRVAEYAAATECRRKRGPRNAVDIPASQPTNSLARAGAVAKPENECHRELPPEMALPHDWTY